MGCHGVGISRIIGAVADALIDDKGLNWPRVIAPFEVVIIADQSSSQDAEHVYDILTTDRSPASGATLHNSGDEVLPSSLPASDAIFDDREVSLAWKLKDADLVGYPVIVVLGKTWRSTGLVEVQCRRLGYVKEEVPLIGLKGYIHGLLSQL